MAAPIPLVPPVTMATWLMRYPELYELSGNSARCRLKSNYAAHNRRSLLRSCDETSADRILLAHPCDRFANEFDKHRFIDIREPLDVEAALSGLVVAEIVQQRVEPVEPGHDV